MQVAGTTADAASRVRTLTFAVTCAVGLLAVLVWGRTPDPYITTHLAMTYELGLVPRGLWGTAADALGLMPRSPTATALLGHVLAVVAVAAFVTRWVAHQGRWAGHRAAVAAAVLLSPAGFPYLAAEMGRLDVVLLTLTLAATRAALDDHRRAPAVMTGIVVTAVLVHEAAVLVTLPLGTVVLASTHGRRRAAWPLVGAAGTLAVLLVAPMPVEQAELHAWLATRIDRVDPFAVMLPYQDLPTAVTRAWRHLTGPGPMQLARTLVAITPVVLLASRALRPEGGAGKPHRALLLAAIAPLGLALLGTDLPRWFALTTLGLAGVAMTIAPRERGADRLDLTFVGLAVTATLALGPLAV